MPASPTLRPVRVVADGPDGSTPHDLVIGVEPSHTVAELTVAMARHLSRSGPPAGMALIDDATGHILDADTPVVGCGLALGATLRLVEVRAGEGEPEPHRPSWSDGADGRSLTTGSPTGPVLVVRSGPDVTAELALRPGVPAAIGRDRSCDLTLSDPTVSRVHAVVDTLADGTVTVGPADEARGPLTVDGTIVEVSTVLGPDRVLRIGSSTLGLRSPPVESAGPGRAGSDGRVAFHRTPYYPVPVEPVVFEPLGSIPESPEPVRFAYLMVVAPLVLGVTMALLASPRFLLFAAFSPVMAVAGWVEQRRRSARRHHRALDRHRDRLGRRREELAAVLHRERRHRHLGAPDLAELAQRALTTDPQLWIRHRGAGDVLRLRVGLGTAPAEVTVRRETRGDEGLRDELEAELEALDLLDDVPVTVDLSGRAVVGLVGAMADTTDLAASLLIQAACLHSPEDLVLAAAVDPGRHLHDWLKWLPHVRASSSPLPGAHLVADGPGSDGLLRRLVTVADDRTAGGDPRIDRRWPRLLVVIDRSLEPDPATVSRLLDLAPTAGISVLWLTASATRVPRQAELVVSCGPLRPGVNRAGSSSLLADTDPAASDRAVEIDRLGADAAGRIARALAPVHDASSASAASALPPVVPLLRVLGTERFDADWVAARWADAGPAVTLPLGLAAAGPLWLDLALHGPHGLLGGTSGSGKSELLTSMVAGLVAANRPDRANVLFVDYKGGALADQFRAVPHVVGSVTNLDAYLARRALTSLRAELDRRMTLLQGRARDLAEMVALHPDEAPPSLVIVVDEFATLVKEIPEFVAGVVDVAQRGRSLGIHLLLATQRPTGAVNENILANTNLRIALRMIDTTESRSVIGADDAATIPVPLRGRGLVRLGPGQLVAFQGPWSSAPAPRARGRSPVVVAPFVVGAAPGSTGSEPSGPGGRPHHFVPGADDGTPTQLQQVLAAVRSAAAATGLGPGPAPWLDELPTRLRLAPLRARHQSDHETAGGSSLRPVIGLIDDPEGQAQYPARLDFGGSGGLALFGAGGTGKTTALRTLAVSAALDDADRGGRLSILGLDFASRELPALLALPSCRAVATGDDLEAVTRIIALLDAELERRRRATAQASRVGGDEPRTDPVLLLVDDYGNLAQTFEGPGAASSLYAWLDALNRIIVDGRQVGIHTALTAGRRAAVKAAVHAAVGNRIVFHQTESGGYTELGLSASAVADTVLPPGRGLLSGGNQVHLAVLADEAPDDTRPGAPSTPPRGARGLTGGDPSTRSFAAAEREAVRAVGERLRSSSDGTGRLEVRPLPDLLSAGGLPVPDRRPGPTPSPVRGPHPDVGAGPQPPAVAIGRADLTLDPVPVDLSTGPLCVVGGPRSGRTTALAVLAGQLERAGCTVWLFGPPGSPLAGMADASSRDRVVLGRPAVVADGFEALADQLERPPGAVADVPPGGRALAPVVALIDDLDLLEDAALDKPGARLLAVGVHWAAATVTVRGYTTNPVVQELRRARSMLLLQPSGGREVQELTGATPSIRPGLPFPPGRGVLVVNRVPSVIQVAVP